MRGDGNQSRLTAAALFMAAGVVLSGTPAWCQTTWYVKSATTGDGSGSSWANAFPALQPALAAAQPGDQIWVAAGTYRPAVPDGDRDTSFAMRHGVALYGGFAGDETSLEARNWELNRTVLSGDLNDDDGDDFENSGENSFHVVVAYNVERSSILDGFVVRAGRADGPGFGATPESQDQGAGLNVYDASPTVRNCTFEQNWALNHGAINDHGHYSVYTDCVFQRNYSDMFGAGLYIHNHTAATVIRCGFFDNVAAAEGAGLYSRSSAGCTVTMCTFVGNMAEFGAGMYNADDSSNTVTDCSFHDNIATTGGGGLYALNAHPTVQRCAFIGNMAGLGDKGGGGGSGGSGGGGIWTEGGTARITECTFTANLASFGAGCYNIHESAAEITNCTFISNHAEEAGGVYTLNSPAVVSRCYFQSNVATGGIFSVGGAVSNYFSNSIVRDCIFDRNTAELGGGAIYNEGEHPQTFNCLIMNNISVGKTEGWGGAILNGYFTLADIVGCVIIRNQGNRAGGIYNMAFAQSNIVNCTIVDNHTIGEKEYGGGVHNYNAAVCTVTNSVMAANTPSQLGGIFEAVRSSFIAGGYAGPGAYRVSRDNPRLVRLPSAGLDGIWETADDDMGDLRPSPGSGCIDSGENAAAVEFVETDAGGLGRFIDDAGVPDSGIGAAPVIDIGAYEFQGRSCLADFNASGAVNSQDLFDFLTAFFAGNADVNRDGSVNSQDFFDFLALFFAGCAS